ncbi:MAG: Rieske 2Fe-2S domain-containing protein [Planctomycetes bacterium]|nr:Rieske 2Fe-2S domain-containing protein [Planctomycetota bacterium]
MTEAESFDTGLTQADLDPERPAPIQTPWGSFALFVVGGQVHAVQSFCPHLDGPLFQGTQSGDTITCPWHQWRFSLVSGARLDTGAQLFGGHPRLCVCTVTRSEKGSLVLSRPGIRT